MIVSPVQFDRNPDPSDVRMTYKIFRVATRSTSYSKVTHWSLVFKFKDGEMWTYEALDENVLFHSKVRKFPSEQWL